MKRAGIIFLLVVMIITGGVRIISLLQPVDRLDNEKIQVRINNGSSTSTIARQLEKNDLIKSDLLFKMVVSIFHLDNALQAGIYNFSRSDNTLKIIKKLSEGKVATFRLTIPEGYTVEEVAFRLGQKSFYSEEDFLRAAKMKYDKGYLPKDNEKIKYDLEGFLYPDTYVLPIGEKPRNIYQYLLSQFEKRSPIKTDGMGDVKKEYNVLEIITIASLIEKEARLDREKPLISAVIYNRLKKDMLLQIDAGIQYSLEQRKEKLYYSDLEIDSPYNTYRYSGLPPGPICNPGDKAIKAALKPAETDYLFYFALEDGSHIFTKTYKEHLEKQNSLLNN